ncbi:MAG: monovalent cation/H(+) antiporter subunit G [Porticoccaceae bacterium]
MQEIIGAILLITGSLFGVIGVLGLLRFPDFFTRMHGASITDTLCAILIIAGLMVLSGKFLVIAKLLMVLFFLLFTTPTAAYGLARTALKAGFKPAVADNPRER